MVPFCVGFFWAGGVKLAVYLQSLCQDIDNQYSPLFKRKLEVGFFFPDKSKSLNFEQQFDLQP